MRDVEVGVVDGARGDRVRSCSGGVDGSGSSTSGWNAGVEGVRNVWLLDCVVLDRRVMNDRAEVDEVEIAGAPGGAGGSPEGAEGTCRSPDSSEISVSC